MPILLYALFVDEETHEQTMYVIAKDDWKKARPDKDEKPNEDILHALEQAIDKLEDVQYVVDITRTMFDAGFDMKPDEAFKEFIEAHASRMVFES